MTQLYLPDVRGRAPVVVFAHGLGGHPRKFEVLLSAWAAAGYMVAAPVFPRTTDELPGGPLFDDIAQQPADLRFVLDALLAAHASRIDPERVAVAGFSLGAFTAYGAAFESSTRDARFRAAIAMSGRLHPFGGDYDLAGMPLLVVHGEHDPYVPYADGLDAYGRARPPKALLTLHVPGHHEPFEDAPATDADLIVREVTTAFLDLVLQADSESGDRLLAAADNPLATLVSDGL